MKLSERQIKTAVDWWADKLHHCKQSGLSEAERRSGENRGYELAEAMMMAAKPKVTDKQVEKFKEELTLALLTAGDGHHDTILAVDYGPDKKLSDALAHAGIREVTGTLPIKTVMWLRDGEVRVRYGYGAHIETIFAPQLPQTKNEPSESQSESSLKTE